MASGPNGRREFETVLTSVVKRRLIGAGALVLLLAGVPIPVALPRRSQVHPSAPLPEFLNTKPGVPYLGSHPCLPCHQDIDQSYGRTDMGRSMSVADVPEQIALVKRPVSVFDASIGRYFKVFVSHGQMYQSEYGLDSLGRLASEETEPIAYTVGSGENGFSYLVDRQGRLFQAPLSYYAKTGSWDLSPAHELGFSRAIEEGCIFCHAGKPQPVANRYGLYRQPAFKKLTIGCQKCHGPGDLHVKARKAGEPVPASGDPTIVNPARLPGWLADNICMYCHEKGDSEVLQPGKDYLDFRPGTPLDATLAIFKVPPTGGTTDESPLLNHYALMIASKCYRSSAGRLSCLSCHDPHYQPVAAEAPGYYNKKCLACHSTGSCSLALTARLASRPPDNCVGCHMPARSLTTIAHSALTDHRIPARPGEPLPVEALPTSSPASPGLTHLTAVPGQIDAVPPLTLLQAYSDVAQEKPAYKTPLRRLLAEVAATERSNPLVLRLLAHDALEQGQAGASMQSVPRAASGRSAAELNAINYLARAIRLGSTWPPDYELLGDLLARSGRFEEAIAILGRGIAIEPYTASFYPLLSDCYVAMGNRSEAIETLQSGRKLFPEDSGIRDSLRKLEPGKP